MHNLCVSLQYSWDHSLIISPFSCSDELPSSISLHASQTGMSAAPILCGEDAKQGTCDTSFWSIKLLHDLEEPPPLPQTQKLREEEGRGEMPQEKQCSL